MGRQRLAAWAATALALAMCGSPPTTAETLRSTILEARYSAARLFDNLQKGVAVDPNPSSSSTSMLNADEISFNSPFNRGVCYLQALGHTAYDGLEITVNITFGAAFETDDRDCGITFGDGDTAHGLLVADKLNNPRALTRLHSNTTAFHAGIQEGLTSTLPWNSSQQTQIVWQWRRATNELDVTVAAIGRPEQPSATFNVPNAWQLDRQLWLIVQHDEPGVPCLIRDMALRATALTLNADPAPATLPLVDVEAAPAASIHIDEPQHARIDFGPSDGSVLIDAGGDTLQTKRLRATGDAQIDGALNVAGPLYVGQGNKNVDATLEYLLKAVRALQQQQAGV